MKGPSGVLCKKQVFTTIAFNTRSSQNEEKLRLDLKGGDKGIIKPNSIHPNSGAIHTNTYVGNLFFEIYQGSELEPIDEFQ